jgi:hypothetical protein
MVYDIKKFVEENYKIIDEDVIDKLFKYGYNEEQILSLDIDEIILFSKKELFNKKNILRKKLSLNFVKKSLDEEYFNNEDIRKMSYETYSLFNDSFINEYSEYISWDRYVLYLSIENKDFTKYIDIINEYNLWYIISANELTIEFIREYKDNLNWSLVRIINNFSESEKEEFKDYLEIKDNPELQNRIEHSIKLHENDMELKEFLKEYLKGEN